MSRRTPTIMNPAARRRASIMRIVSFPVAAILIVVAVKLIAMVIVAQITIVQYDEKQYETSAQAGQWNLAVNLIEPYKAPFNLGTAFLGSRLHEKAREQFEIALETAPLPASCDVRMNLSYAIEGLGDDSYTAGELEDAIGFYTEAAGVLADADESCPDTTERQEELLAKAQKVQDELDAQNQPPPPPPPIPGGDEPESGDGGDDQTDTPFDDIDARNDAAEQERQNQENADRGDEYGDSSPEKPW